MILCLVFLGIIWFERLERVVILPRNRTKLALVPFCSWYLAHEKILEEYYSTISLHGENVNRRRHCQEEEFQFLYYFSKHTHTIYILDLNLCNLDKCLSRRKFYMFYQRRVIHPFSVQDGFGPLNHFHLYLSKARKYIMFLVGCDHCLSSCYPSDH